MAIKIKSASEIAAKYARVTPGRSGDYEDGIQATSPSDYVNATTVAEPNYERGVTQGIARKAFGKGVRKAGDKWRDKSLKHGPSRYMTGTGDAAPDYEAGYAPYREVISGLTLPPRGPAGDPKNIERVRVVSEALRKAKVSS